MENSPLAGVSPAPKQGPHGGDIAQRAVLHQLQVGGHAAGIDAHGESAVAGGVAAQDVGHGAHVVKGAAGAAGHQALLHPNAAVVHLADQVDAGTHDLAVGLLLAGVQDVLGVLQQFADGDGVAGMHGQGDGALHGGKINVHAAVIIGHVGGLHLLEGFGTAVDGQVFLGGGVGFPDGRPAGSLGGHHVDAVAVFHGQLGHAGAHELHHLVFHIAVGVHRAADGQGHVLGAHAGTGLAVQVDQDDAGTGHVIGAAHQLLGQFAAALAHAQGADGAVAGMAVAAQDHAAAARHHLAVERVDDGHVGGHIDAAVLMGRAEGEHVVVLVDGAAHGAQAVVAVSQHIGHGEFLHAGCPGRLDDAHVGDIVAGQAVKAHLQAIHIAALVMGLQDAVGDGALLGAFLRYGMAGLLGGGVGVGDDLAPVQQIHAGIV